MDLDVKPGVRYRMEQRLERLPKAVKEEEHRSAGRTTGELRLDVAPADAFVDLDGRSLRMASPRRSSAALHHLPIGHHTRRFRREVYRTAESEVDVTINRPAGLRVQLERE
jgi:hypothetical protein